MVAVFFAKLVGDSVCLSVYDTHIKIKGAPVLVSVSHRSSSSERQALCLAPTTGTWKCRVIWDGCSWHVGSDLLKGMPIMRSFGRRCEGPILQNMCSGCTLHITPSLTRMSRQILNVEAADVHVEFKAALVLPLADQVHSVLHLLWMSLHETTNEASWKSTKTQQMRQRAVGQAVSLTKRGQGRGAPPEVIMQCEVTRGWTGVLAKMMHC